MYNGLAFFHFSHKLYHLHIHIFTKHLLTDLLKLEINPNVATLCYIKNKFLTVDHCLFYIISLISCLKNPYFLHKVKIYQCFYRIQKGIDITKHLTFLLTNASI